MNKISVVINTLNEELNIRGCLDSVVSFADEIIICDMYSEDKTVEISKEFNAKVFYHERIGFVEPARFFAISQASHEWVLVLDADERMTNELKNSLKEIIQNDKYEVVCFWVLYNYFGRYIKNGGFYFNIPRLFKKDIYIKSYNIHDELVHNNFKSLLNTNKIVTLPKGYHIIHEAYPDFEKYLTKTLAMYSIVDSKGRFKSNEDISFFKVIGAPIKEFLKRYFIFKGFLDGKIGLILCYLKSQYTFYTLLNLWFLIKNDNDK